MKGTAFTHAGQTLAAIKLAKGAGPAVPRPFAAFIEVGRLWWREDVTKARELVQEMTTWIEDEF